MKGLGEDMRDLRPTLMPTVPRVLNRLYNDFTNTARRRLFIRWMANKCLQTRMDQLFRRNGKKPGLMNKLLFGNIKKHLGGNVRLMVVASAPVDPGILTFIRATLDCVV